MMKRYSSDGKELVAFFERKGLLDFWWFKCNGKEHVDNPFLFMLI